MPNIATFARAASKPMFRRKKLSGWKNEDDRRDLSALAGTLEHWRVDDDVHEEQRKSVSRPIKTDVFLRKTFSEMDGSELKNIGSLEDLQRHGGGADDAWRAIKNLDRPKKPFDVRITPLEVAEAIFGVEECGKVLPMTLRESLVAVGINPETAAGPTWRALGFTKKGPAGMLIGEVCKMIVKGEDVQCRYGLAGRTALRRRDEIQDRIDEGKQIGRVVFMADAHESPIAAMFVKPLVSRVRTKTNALWMGFNKFGEDPSALLEIAEAHDVYANIDVSQFDQGCGERAKTFALDVMEAALDLTGREERNGYNWLRKEINDVRVVCEDGRTRVNSDFLPSGSGLTSIIGSIVSYTLLLDSVPEILTKGRYRIGTQGDDMFLCLKNAQVLGQPVTTEGAMKDFVERIAKTVRVRTGFRFKPSASVYGTKATVGFIQPNLPEFILDGSSSVMRAYFARRRKELNRELSFEERWRVLPKEPDGGAGGNTHRWSYHFRGRFKFLSHYIKVEEDGTVLMIRPTKEVVERLFHPEKHEVKTLDGHLVRLRAALVENRGNRLTVNRLMHYYHSAVLRRREGLLKSSDLSRKIREDPAYAVSVKDYRERDGPVIEVFAHDPEFAEEWLKVLDSTDQQRTRMYGGRNVDWRDVRNAREGIFTPKMMIPLGQDEKGLEQCYYLLNDGREKLRGAVGYAMVTSESLRMRLFTLIRKYFEKRFINWFEPELSEYRDRISSWGDV